MAAVPDWRSRGSRTDNSLTSGSFLEIRTDNTACEEIHRSWERSMHLGSYHPEFLFTALIVRCCLAPLWLLLLIEATLGSGMDGCWVTSGDIRVVLQAGSSNQPYAIPLGSLCRHFRYVLDGIDSLDPARHRPATARGSCPGLADPPSSDRISAGCPSAPEEFLGLPSRVTRYCIAPAPRRTKSLAKVARQCDGAGASGGWLKRMPVSKLATLGGKRVISVARVL